MQRGVIIPTSLLNHFGLSKQGYHWSKTTEVFKEDLKESILNRQMIALIGQYGVGKTILTSKVFGELKNQVLFIKIKNVNREALTVNHMMSAFIDEHTEESPRRCSEARTSQFTRLIGQLITQSKRDICFVVEDAHRPKVEFFRSLKELREIEFNGINPLFSVLLIGHKKLGDNLSFRKEVLLRSVKLELCEATGWMDLTERIEYLRTVFGRAITKSARQRIATLHKFPLEMDYFIYEKMKEARLAGKTVLDDDVVQPTLKELYDAAKESDPDAISYRKLAKEINENGKLNKKISEGSVHAIINSDAGNKKERDIIQRTLAAVENRGHERKMAANE